MNLEPETPLEVLADLDREIDALLRSWLTLRTAHRQTHDGLNNSVERNLHLLGDRAAARLDLCPDTLPNLAEMTR